MLTKYDMHIYISSSHICNCMNMQISHVHMSIYLSVEVSLAFPQALHSLLAIQHRAAVHIRL